jgi:hypothetical protein
MPTTIRRSTKLTTTDRNVIVLRRYTIKVAHNDLRPGDVVLVVRNDKGVEYTTTLRRNKNHECTCPSRKPCYHIKSVVKAENARWEAGQAKKAEGDRITEEAKAIKVAKHAAKVSTVIVELAKVREAKQSAAKAPKSAEQAMMDAPLTKNNKGFSVLR